MNTGITGSGIWARPGWRQHPKIEGDMTRDFGRRTVDVRLIPGGGWFLAIREGAYVRYPGDRYPTAEDAQIAAETAFTPPNPAAAVGE